MTSSKGQGMIGQVILFSMIIITSIGMFIMFVSQDNVYQRTVTPEINYAISDVKKRSSVTTLLNMPLWRSPDPEDGSRAVDVGKYNNHSFKHIASVYFSSPLSSDQSDRSNDEIIIDQKEYSRQKVKENMEKYMQNTMDRYYTSGGLATTMDLESEVDTGYSLVLFHDIDGNGNLNQEEWNSNPDESSYEVVQAANGNLNQLSASGTYPIAVTGGKDVSIVLRTSGGAEASGVNPE